MMSTRYSFVILHYNATDDTIECVDSVRKYMAGKDYHIVLVDNASPNGSGPLLREKYGSDNDITLILSDKNLGFSGGNNIGFAYAKQHLSPDFIVMLNNDTLLLQADFAELIESEHLLVFPIPGVAIVARINPIGLELTTHKVEACFLIAAHFKVNHFIGVITTVRIHIEELGCVINRACETAEVGAKRVLSVKDRQGAIFLSRSKHFLDVLHILGGITHIEGNIVV